MRALAADDRDMRLVDLLETQHVAIGLEGVDPLRIASGDHRRMLLRAHRAAPFIACGERVWSTPRGLKQAPLVSDTLDVEGGAGTAQRSKRPVT